MKCPYCQIDSDFVPQAAVDALTYYGGQSLVATTCCKKPVKVSPHMSFKVTVVQTDEDQDSWGTPFSKDSVQHFKELLSD